MCDISVCASILAKARPSARQGIVQYPPCNALRDLAASNQEMVGQSDRRLGMTVLDIQDTVVGYRNLNEEIVQRLMVAEDLGVVPHSLQERVLGRLITSPDALVADVSGAVVVATGQWVFSIHGDSPVHCVDALLKYRNAVATQLSATVTGQLTTPLGETLGYCTR